MQIAADELRPGDLLDKIHSSHVRLVWRVRDVPGQGRMVSWIEAVGGSHNRVRLVFDGASVSALAGEFHFINMNDPQSRRAETTT